MDFEGVNKNQEFYSKGNSTPFVFSIVIPTFNSSDLLLRCLKALENQSALKSEFEVIVANDGSTDRTIDTLSKFKIKTNLNLKESVKLTIGWYKNYFLNKNLIFKYTQKQITDYFN